MRFSRRVVLANTSEDRKFLTQLGFNTSESELIIAFDVFEDDLRWPELSAWLTGKGLSSPILTTHYSPLEIAAAQWLYVRADWYHGYPEPDMGHFGYRSTTYDPERWCPECNCGKHQRAPFQMKAEPKWGKKGLLMLHWVYDEIFVRPEVYRDIFAPFGVLCRPVLDTKKRELRSVVQLVVEETVSLKFDGFPSSTCPVCRQIKYEPVVRGMMPPMKTQPKSQVVRVEQYKGLDGNAVRAVLISQAVATRLLESKVKGFALEPIASD